MIMEIQVLPTPAGAADSRYAHAEAAIAVVAASGLTHEVGPLGTSAEGPPDTLWALARAVHEATLTAGAAGVVTNITLAEAVGRELTMHGLTAPHRR